MSVFLTHYGQLEKDGVPPTRIAMPPASLSKLGVQRMDMGARQVKEDMLKQYDAEHKQAFAHRESAS